jgi:DNA-binding transcriptional regulator YhcF (GntR family)
LVTQVVLGILSDDLAPGQRLPSTREPARRFKLHPNTVSAGYRQLQRERWVELRRGSGVYVAARKPDAQLSPAVALDQMIAALCATALRRRIFRRDAGRFPSRCCLNRRLRSCGVTWNS